MWRMEMRPWRAAAGEELSAGPGYTVETGCEIQTPYRLPNVSESECDVRDWEALGVCRARVQRGLEVCLGVRVGVLRTWNVVLVGSVEVGCGTRLTTHERGSWRHRVLAVQSRVVPVSLTLSNAKRLSPAFLSTY